MKKLLPLFLFAFVFINDSFASGIATNTNSAPCDNATLSQYNGTADIEINWEPNTIGLKWYNGDQQISGQTSCVYNGTITVPPQPTKPGYTFNGWKVWKVTVPDGYTQLQYIQTTGTQWIDTGIKGNMSYTYEIDFQQTDTGLYRNWGAFEQQSYIGKNMSLTYVRFETFIVRWEYLNDQQKNVQLPLVDTNRHLLKIVSGQVYWDGTYKGIGDYQDNFVINYNLFLGTANPAGTTPTANAHSKYYSYKVWNTNDELIQNFLPARRNSDNVVGMWDTVSGRFFTNAGTGTFVAGPAVQ